MTRYKFPKATRDDAKEVIRLWFETEVSPRDISTKLNISKKAVIRIVYGKLFTSLERPDIFPEWRYYA